MRALHQITSKYYKYSGYIIASNTTVREHLRISGGTSFRIAITNNPKKDYNSLLKQLIFKSDNLTNIN